jgi:hypothetical protein
MGTFGELTSVLRFVLPGLVMAWAFYGLSSYQKPGEFERVAQALVFTALLDVLARSLVACGILAGRLGGPLLLPLETSILAAALAVPAGVVLAYLANNDIVHGILRRLGVTTASGRPDQWDAAFRLFGGYVTLDLVDGRRISGWPVEWPDRPGEGQFLLRDHRWITPPGSSLPSATATAILVPAKEVDYVEFHEEVPPR